MKGNGVTALTTRTSSSHACVHTKQFVRLEHDSKGLGLP
jgi:hypothetical protein